MNSNKILDLLNFDHVKFLFEIFANTNSEIRLVGGSIRDAIIGRDIKDIDMATSIHPSDIIDLLKQSNIEYDDFAMRYGSIIAYPLDQKVQIKLSSFLFMRGLE